MNDLLEIIPYVLSAAVILGVRFFHRKLSDREQDDWVPRWLLRRGPTHHADTPKIQGEGEHKRRAHVAQKTVRRAGESKAQQEQASEPTRSRFGLPGPALRTPTYGGRPARLWWLPEQEIPKAPEDATPKSVAHQVACGKCGEPNPADSVFCGKCGLFFEPPDSAADQLIAQVTGRRQKTAGSRRGWRSGVDRSMAEWR